ncbi:hypothetical protein T439DRAFT_335163 [Meredithblackwellia eburnea MCA 4105]
MMHQQTSPLRGPPQYEQAYSSIPLESKLPGGEIELEERVTAQPMYGYLSTTSEDVPSLPKHLNRSIYVSSKLPRESFARHLFAAFLFLNGLFLLSLAIFITVRTPHHNGQWLLYGVSSSTIQIGTLTAFTGLYISGMRLVFDYAFVQILMAHRGRLIQRTMGVRLKKLLVSMTNIPWGRRGTARIWSVRLSLALSVILAGFLSRQGLVSVFAPPLTIPTLPSLAFDYPGGHYVDNQDMSLSISGLALSLTIAIEDLLSDSLRFASTAFGAHSFVSPSLTDLYTYGNQTKNISVSMYSLTLRRDGWTSNYTQILSFFNQSGVLPYYTTGGTNATQIAFGDVAPGEWFASKFWSTSSIGAAIYGSVYSCRHDITWIINSALHTPSVSSPKLSDCRALSGNFLPNGSGATIEVIPTVAFDGYRWWDAMQPRRPIPRPNDLGEVAESIDNSTLLELGYLQAALTAVFGGLIYPNNPWYDEATGINTSIGFNLSSPTPVDLYNNRLPFGHMNNATLQGNTEQYIALTKTGVGALVMFSSISFLLAVMLTYGGRGVETSEWPGDWVTLFDGDMERIVKFRDDGD